MITYYSLNQYYRDRFGQKIYKLSLNAGMSCPNRDGTIGTGGCIFCSAGGSGDFAASSTLSIFEQIEDAKKRVEKKITGSSPKYIAYFQAYTNTYASTDYLRTCYMEAIRHPDIVGISVATRPDCLPQDVLTLLAECNAIKPVWVELGLQTIHDATADYIRRGYPLTVYDSAVKELLSRGIEVVTHVILGLPGESKEMMLDTVRHVINSGAKGIKLQLLHVLSGTDLAKDYEAGKFETLTFDEYIAIIIDCLRLLPPDMVVHRLTGDGPKKLLVAPLWSANKKHVLNQLNNAIHKA
ncbi:MAG: TIGR01212 family radical SAM protein [Lachnospiraceae bacterium]|nr:TIGR01212 family radical SAM protein [Lachnospiraceae bacterium]